MKEVIQCDKGPCAVGPYSPAVRLNGMVFLSGQIPSDPASGEMIAGSIQVQTARVLENMKLVLEAAGLTLEDVVKTTVFLKNMSDFPGMNETYAGFFETPPARSTVEVARLPRDAQVEIEAIAMDHGKYPFAK